jgi:Fe-S-cluster containining protein
VTRDTLTADDIFQCKQCGECCTGYGGTYVTPGDIKAIALFIGEDPDTFVERFCQLSGGKPVLRLSENGKCVFFDPEKQCTIHPVKPRMCKAWPFVDAILNRPGNWEIMAEACPGIRTGFPHDAVKAVVKKEIDALNALRKDLDLDEPS